MKLSDLAQKFSDYDEKEKGIKLLQNSQFYHSKEKIKNPDQALGFGHRALSISGMCLTVLS